MTVTHTETEALLLEHNYISCTSHVTTCCYATINRILLFFSGDTHPRLAMHRGAKHAKGEYFGPFPNGYAVRETRAAAENLSHPSCENSVYRNRSRPCLQYQIGRCRGRAWPGWSAKKYAQQVEYVRLFLAGKDDRC